MYVFQLNNQVTVVQIVKYVNAGSHSDFSGVFLCVCLGPEIGDKKKKENKKSGIHNWRHLSILAQSGIKDQTFMHSVIPAMLA